ncbi:Multidrug resistance protein 1 [Gryganskiella cystojenkinii]|nr:Multidrug resistance protein 1 [Gryganskiella cystojenkinii]
MSTTIEHELHELDPKATTPTPPHSESHTIQIAALEDTTTTMEPKDSNKKNKKNKKDGKEKEEEEAKVSYLQLYRFATPWDWTCVFLGTLCAFVNGVGQPLIALLLGGVVTKITINGDDIPAGVAEVRIIVIKFTVVGLIMAVAAYGQMCFFTLSAENQTKKIRERYLHAILRQDVAWHDTSRNSESLNTRLSADTQLIFDGLADKVGLCLSSLAAFVAGMVIAFTHGWKMSLVLLATMPLIAAAGAFMSSFAGDNSKEGQDSYASAGAVAEAAISSIRTVYAFDGQKRELQKFNVHIEEAYKSGVKKAIGTGIGMGSIMLILFSSYALAFWYGARVVRSGDMVSGDVLTVLFGVVVGSMSIGNVGPNVAVFAKAQAAAFQIFKTIERVPVIDSSSPTGAKPENLQGHIVLRDIDFAYPSRPDVPILRGLNVEVLPGQTIALVGHSGSGKSTIVGLVERFYDPLAGSIQLDGHELKDINVRFLRDSIGLVSQEPVLFNGTIKQNITYGVRKEQSIPTMSEIEQACKLANAHEFISRLPHKYDTLVGERGALLSGGQKQRIAIARALIKNPKILLLDEATSALDTESERVVQAALDNAATGRSTIVIAHRLSTIMNADQIYVMDKGIVVEKGTHESLMAHGGIYSDYVAKQQLKSGGVDKERSAADDTVPLQPRVSIVQDQRPTIHRNATTKVGSFLRRMSSHHSAAGSEKEDMLTINIPEDEEMTLAREKKEAARKLKLQKAPMGRTIKYLKDDIGLVFFGILLSMVQGAVFPTMSQVMSRSINALTLKDSPGYDLIHETNHYAIMFIVVGLAAFVSFCGGLICFLIVGERMTRKMRYLSFKAILSQEIAFFDKTENSTGALAGRLATDAQQMLDMVSQMILTMLAALSSIACGLGFAFAATWQMTFIILAAVPVIGLGQYLELAALSGFGEKTRKAYERSGNVAAEAIANIRTVASLSKEDRFESRYIEVTKEPHQYAINKALYASFGYGMAQGVSYWAYSIGFYGGYRLVEAHIISWQQMWNCMFAIVFAAMSLGHITSELPKYAKGKQSAINIYELLDKDTTIDVDREGLELKGSVNGAGDSLSLEKVQFTYPTRSDVPIFKGVDLQAQPAQTIALVGPSGCGKSTVIALLERWYEVDGGKVVVDSHNIKDIQLHNLRNRMALVGQEPVLFDVSIKDNILYGLPDDEEGTMEQVIEAARVSNIHDFVMSLPQGYDTRVGDKGSQLSGGQKQRIAIARALIRNPKVLLLDEATSALDSESEKLVQEALDKARSGRTTIVIAHRLSTIQDADLILVVKDGQVVESGRHYELIALNGVYSELCKRQNL